MVRDVDARVLGKGLHLVEVNGEIFEIRKTYCRMILHCCQFKIRRCVDRPTISVEYVKEGKFD